MTFDYSDLDNEILSLIASGKNKAAQLVHGTKAPLDPATKGGRYRAVDRRLQALRRQGKIAFDIKAGWHLVR